MDTFSWSLAPVLEHGIIQEIPLNDQIDLKTLLLMILIPGDDKLYIGTQTQLLIICKFPDPIKGFNLLSINPQALFVNEISGKLWSINYDFLIRQIGNNYKRKRTTMDDEDVKYDTLEDGNISYHHQVQWDTTGFPKGYQMNDNVKILTLHDLDANILLSLDSSVNLLFFDHYLATYGGKTNPCRLSIFQLACSNDKNSIRLQFIMDTELAGSQEDENRTTNLILQSFYPSNLDEIDRHKPYPQIHPSLFTSIFGVDSALSKSYGFMYGHIDGKVRVYSCNMQTSPAVTDIFYDLCQQVKLITAITVPTKHVNSNQSTVNNAILLLGLQGKIVIACRGLIGKDAIGLVFRQYNLFGPILSQCLFQDIDAVDSLLYSSGNDLNIVQFNTGTKPTVVSPHEGNKLHLIDEEMETSSNESETGLPILPQVLHSINKKIDNIISIQVFKHESQSVTFIAMKSTGHLIKFNLSMFRKVDILQRNDLNPQNEINKRLNQLANLTSLKTELTSALSGYDEKIKSVNGAVYQFHNINKCKQLNQEQIKVLVRVQHDMADSLSYQNGKFLIHITDNTKLLNSNYSILVIICGYTHQSSKLRKNIISFSFPLHDTYSSPIIFNIPFKRLLGNIITLSEHSDINFNILFTLTVECLLCLNASVTSNLRNSQFLKLEKHSILKPYSCIALSLKNIDILHFVNESFIGRKPSLKLTHQRVNLTNSNLVPVSINFEATVILLRQILHDSKMNHHIVDDSSDSKIAKQLEWKTINLKMKLLSTKPIDLCAFREQIFINLLNGDSDCIQQHQGIEEISITFFDELQVTIRIECTSQESELPRIVGNEIHNYAVISNVVLHISSISIPALLSIYGAISTRIQEILQSSLWKPFQISSEIETFDQRILQAELHNVRDQVCRIKYLSSMEGEHLTSTKFLSVMSSIADLQIKIANATTIVASET